MRRHSSLGAHLLPSLEDLLHNLVVPDGMWMARRSASGRIPQWAVDEALGVPVLIVSRAYSADVKPGFSAPLGGLKLSSWMLLGFLLGFLLLIITLIVIAPTHPISSNSPVPGSSMGTGLPSWQDSAG